MPFIKYKPSFTRCRGRGVFAASSINGGQEGTERLSELTQRALNRTGTKKPRPPSSSLSTTDLDSLLYNNHG